MSRRIMTRPTIAGPEPGMVRVRTPTFRAHKLTKEQQERCTWICEYCGECHEVPYPWSDRNLCGNREDCVVNGYVHMGPCPQCFFEIPEDLYDPSLNKEAQEGDQKPKQQRDQNQAQKPGRTDKQARKK